MADFKMDGNYFRDRNGNRLGEIDGNYIRDASGNKIGEFDGTTIRDSNGNNIGSIDDVRRVIDGHGGYSLVALWLFFIR